MELMSLCLPYEIYYRHTFHDSAWGCAKNSKVVKRGKSCFPCWDTKIIELGKTTWPKPVRFLQRVLYFSRIASMFHFVSHGRLLHCKTFSCICAVYIPSPKWMPFLPLLLWWMFDYQLGCLGYFLSCLANIAENPFSCQSAVTNMTFGFIKTREDLIDLCATCGLYMGQKTYLIVLHKKESANENIIFLFSPYCKLK